MTYGRERPGMKSRIFLILCNFLIFNCNTIAEFNTKNTFLEWQSGVLQIMKENINLFTKDQKNPLFLTHDISDKEINLDLENIIIPLLIDDIRLVSGLEIRLSEKRASNNYLYYSVPFFHDYEFNLIKSSKKTEIGLSKANFKLKGEEFKKVNYITFYFSTNSAEVRLSVWPIKKSKKISDGVLTLTFDDGPKDNLLAAEILKKYNIPATAYIMPNALGTKDFLTSKELRSISKKNWDIESHHETPFTYFSKDSLDKEISDVESFLINNKYKKKNFHLAYPLGKTNESVIEAVSKKFSTARIASGGIETIPPVNLHMLRAYNVLKTTTPKELREVIKRTKESKQWLILMFHHIKDEPVDDIDYSTENFEELAKIIKESDISIMTMNEVWNKYLK